MKKSIEKKVKIIKNKVYGFDQAEALKIKKRTVDEKGRVKDIRLDFTDLIIIRWFIDFYPKMIKKTFDGEEYAWVQYHKILDDLPLLNIKKRALYERMQKICELGVMKHKYCKAENAGTYSYYTFGKKLSSLTGGGMQQNDYGVCSKAPTGMQSSNNGYAANCPSIYNNTIKDNKVKDNNTEPKRYGGYYL